MRLPALHLFTFVILLPGCPGGSGGGGGGSTIGGSSTSTAGSGSVSVDTTVTASSGESQCVDDMDEPNDSPGEAIDLLPGLPLDDADVARTPALCPGDVDYYTFTLDTSNYLIAEARFDRSMGNLRLSVLGPNGAEMWSSMGGRLAAVNRLIDSGGLYTLRVEHLDGTAKLDYELRVRALPTMP